MAKLLVRILGASTRVGRKPTEQAQELRTPSAPEGKPYSIRCEASGHAEGNYDDCLHFSAGGESASGDQEKESRDRHAELPRKNREEHRGVGQMCVGAHKGTTFCDPWPAESLGSRSGQTVLMINATAIPIETSTKRWKATREMPSGAALRASAIAASRSIKYCESGSIVG